MRAERIQWYQRAVQRISATRPIAWLLSKILHIVDPLVLQYTRNRKSLTSILAGLPVIELTATGAKSGLPRSVLLLGVIDGEKVILFATNWGRKFHPAWYYNLRSNPEVSLTFEEPGNKKKNGSGSIFSTRNGEYVAREADESERKRYWECATQLFAGYRNYMERTGDRIIPIFVLTPKN